MKQSKKFWALTEKQKRNDRTYMHKCMGNAPKKFRKAYYKAFRNQDKKALRRLLSGFDEYEFMRGTYRQSANWDWW